MIAPINTVTTRDRALAVVSHELKQPLNVIRLNAALLQRLPEAGSTTRIRSIARAIERATESQARIIEDLLELSRVRTGKLSLQRTDVDLGRLVADLTTALGAGCAPGRVRLELESSAPLICHADAVRVRQIVGNLVTNAIKATARGGDVVVRVRDEGGFARLSVADTGCGIDPAFLPHVFGLFRQADGSPASPDGGLGIGLALVHGLAVAHGGFVKAASSGINLGAEFSVWLPREPLPPGEGNPQKEDTSTVAPLS